MSCELETEDRWNRPVRLDRSNWEKHKVRHPEVIPYHEQLAVAVADPDVVVDYYEGGTVGKMKYWWLPSTVDVEGPFVWMRPSGPR